MRSGYAKGLNRDQIVKIARFTDCIRTYRYILYLIGKIKKFISLYSMC